VLDGIARLGRQLLETGQLREGIELAEVRALLWHYLAVDGSERLVLRRGWSPERYTGWLAGALTRALCGPPGDLTRGCG